LTDEKYSLVRILLNKTILIIKGTKKLTNEISVPLVNNLAGDPNFENNKTILASLVPNPEIVIGMLLINIVSGTKIIIA
jgi:hypothetical protein